MKSRFLKTTLLAVVIVCGIWVLANRDKIKEPGDVVRLIKENLAVAQVNFGSIPNRNSQSNQWIDGTLSRYPSTGQTVDAQEGKRFVTNVLRIALFRLDKQVTGSQSDQAVDMLADICRRYDAIALQEIDGTDNSWLVRLTNRMNALGSICTTDPSDSNAKNGHQADYFFVSEYPPASNSGVQSAIVFNRRTLDLDVSQRYTINDPDDLLTGDPLVALFRARGPNPDQAFTFTLVNAMFDFERAESELACLQELFRAIRNDGRGEDDVLIAGNLKGGDPGLQPRRKQTGLTWVVSNQPTDIAHQALSDNLVFSEVATVEFTGGGGVFDFMRHYNLRLDDAMSISRQMPVWAEFSIFEGSAPPLSGTPDRTARVRH